MTLDPERHPCAIALRSSSFYKERILSRYLEVLKEMKWEVKLPMIMMSVKTGSASSGEEAMAKSTLEDSRVNASSHTRVRIASTAVRNESVDFNITIPEEEVRKIKPCSD